MHTDQLKQEIIEYSKKIGIDKIGFASADVFGELKERLRRQQELKYQSGFEKGTIEERTEPKRLLPEAQSIISIALAYPSRMKDAPRSTREERRGLFARASWGVDYHIVMRDRLEKLAAFIQEKVPDGKNKVMVDTGELSDRAVAERAGIGFSGKNTSIITPEFGSFVYLGELITNVPFVPDEPVDDSCGSCTKCIDACPTGAIVQGGQLNAQRCIAFLTQTKDFLPDEFRSKIGNRVYGCDTCQVVCPKNHKVDFHIHPEFEPEHEVAKPKLIPMLRMSNREFKRTFGHISGSWRGKKPIQRNTLIALGHYKDKTAVEEIIDVMLSDPRPVIRGTAAWSLGKIGTEEAFQAIKRAMDNEDDEQVRFEMEKGLAFQQPSSTK
ncbi:tRNA epoxyqueuosine(34) reductase QueG [Virgibacillus sp. AGTR]|uniref:tRNA epoxyqueuosine(34) reductase QueG n=1 Tax=unclassified Virgibacillus TaxID=2620237 RepID=UPI000EF4EBB5|nr:MULTISPECIES: tRNA epoxyqueuosine(34) reductase QueG [unclassified Virgibacillus]MCC2252132.1 tRNA epoxyqueuosine(34) reductase QueG [Virgibacillus sp. AGTR]QRZ16400.1 tRNA epoxyqueuosine(34) reductase QueG [Virgibacillus sp. AGTR]